MLPRYSVCMLALFLGFGCADQGEGERCELTNANQDCGDGLTCTPLRELRNVDPASEEFTSAGRCCPPETEVSSSLCDRVSGGSTPSTGGGGGAGGSDMGGETGGAGGTFPGAGGTAGSAQSNGGTAGIAGAAVAGAGGK